MGNEGESWGGAVDKRAIDAMQYGGGRAVGDPDRARTAAQLVDTTNAIAPSVSSEHVDTALGKRINTGDPYLDSGIPGDRPGASGLLLGPPGDRQRERVVDEIRRRIDDAGKAFQDARQELRTEALIPKPPGEDPILVSLVLNLAAGYIGDLVAKGAAVLLSGKGEALSWVEQKSRDAVAHEVTDSGHSRTELVIEAFTETGKEKVKTVLQPRDEQSQEGIKLPDEVVWLDRLGDAARVRFARMRTKVLGGASDADLLILLEGFAPSKHTAAIYRRKIMEKLERYKESGIPDTPSGFKDGSHERTGIGRRGAWGDDVASFGDRSVVRVEFLSGSPPEYAFLRNVVSMGMNGGWKTVDESKPGRKPLDPKHYRTRYEPNVKHATSEFGEKTALDGFIDREFEAEAIARHTQMWGTPPRTVLVDDSDEVWEPRRALAARENKARIQAKNSAWVSQAFLMEPGSRHD